VKGQIAIEYIVFIGILLLLLVVVMVVVSVQEKNALRERVIDDAKRIALMVTNEINVAVNIGDGYSHNFSIPYKLRGGVDYDIYTSYQRLYVNWSESGNTREYSIPLITSNINGAFSKGENKIKNINGLIEIE
jgi:hypothetical protein